MLKKTGAVALMLTALLGLDARAEDQTYSNYQEISLISGHQYYQASRMLDVIGRMELAGVQVDRLDQYTVQIKYNHEYTDYVDDKLLYLVKKHEREVRNLGVVFFDNDPEYLNHMKSIKQLKAYGTKVRKAKGYMLCDKDASGCEVSVIQFYAVRN